MPQTCFVVMGFGEKTDYKTSRVLDLNKTYKHIIKKAVEAAGLVCVRADEIPHSGTIDAPMYEQLLDADLVIADLSTSNLNAAYELGIRHALKPATTIIIAEEQFSSPFDLNHIVVRSYRHDGKALDIDVVEEFKASLTLAIKDIMVNGRIDSPVYTFLPLTAPTRRPVAVQAAAAAPPAAGSAAPASLAALMDGAEEAKSEGDFLTARSLLKAARKISPNDSYVVQQLALVTYKAKVPDEAQALEQARSILLELNPLHSNNAETLGLWGAVHKRRYLLSKERSELDAAIFAYEKGYRLLADFYNGINWAYLLNMRAALSEPADAIADFILARRTRADVAGICTARLAELKASDDTRDQRYWLLATLSEAALGLGDEALSADYLAQAAQVATAAWMTDSTRTQLQALRAYLADSPLKWIKAD
jgi:tetratricopeptide (TPR) repeat protein